MAFDHVDYSVLDTAKNRFIEASRKTLSFAKDFGFVPSEALGASANVFALNLKPFLQKGAGDLYITLLPEGLGTADDARPEDLTKEEAYRFWFNIGIKTVSVMTNDAASAGMQTVLIGLYLPSSTPELVFNESFMGGFLDGFVDGCKTVGCVYISGETPQLKNKIYPEKLDIAGAVFGLVPPGHSPVSPSALKAGDKIVLVESSGPHENGFTTFRALAQKLPNGFRTDIGNGQQFWEATNAPSKLYTPLIQQILKRGIMISNIENITGHGWQKIMRPSQSFEYRIHTMLPVTPVFSFVEKSLEMTPAQMIRVFNYGAGMAIFIPKQNDADKIVEIAATLELNAVVAGEVRESKKRAVVVEPLGETIAGDELLLKK